MSPASANVKRRGEMGDSGTQRNDERRRRIRGRWRVVGSAVAAAGFVVRHPFDEPAGESNLVNNRRRLSKTPFAGILRTRYREGTYVKGAPIAKEANNPRVRIYLTN